MTYQMQLFANAIKEINAELKQGKDSEKVFMRQAPVLGKFTAQMLGLASKSGNMAEIYESARNLWSEMQNLEEI